MSNVGVNRFCHPGTLICPKEIAAFYQKQIPHPNALTKLYSSTPVDYKPSPIENINLGAYGAGIGHKEITSDGAMCYQQTIAFLHTRNIAYAKNAINIINVWANTNKRFEGSNAPLEASWAVTSMIRSAEYMRKFRAERRDEYNAQRRAMYAKKKAKDVAECDKNKQ